MTEHGKIQRPRKVAEYRGEEARKHAAQVLMDVTGTATAEEAQDVLLGRPRIKQGETTVQVHFKTTQEMAHYIDEQRKRSGMRYASEYLRELVARDMREHHRLQDA